MRRAAKPRTLSTGAACRGVLVAALLCPACFHSQFRSKPRVAVVGGDPIVQMASPESFPSLDEPALVALRRHTDPPAPWEPILGVRLGSERRAYPLGLLDRYEVVNDEAEGIPYVVTRCPLAQIAAVYDRELDGRILTFVNSGALWRDTLVMQDRETGSLWTVATGRAIFGPLAGRRLRPIPAILSTSHAWSEAHPHARYLDTGEQTETPLVLSLYAASPWEGVSGVKTGDGRHEPKAKVYSVADGAEALAFTEEDIKGLALVQTTLAGCPVLLEWDAREDSPRAFRLQDGWTEELAVVPMYWFALHRHFQIVRTLLPSSRASAR
ncbi:MAG: DUF3179 domain-containing (seleno)protein [Acidobacteriota bacterium]